MMTFIEFMEAMQAAIPSPLWLTQATAASLVATPGKDDTTRALERAKRRGTAVTPDDLRASISPESQEAAKKGICKLATAQSPGDSGSTSGLMGTAGRAVRA